MAYSLVHFEPHSSSLEGAACGTNLSIYWTNNLQNHESSDKHEPIVGPNLSLNLPRLGGI